MEWIKCCDRLPNVKNGKFKVKIENEVNDKPAFFYSDQFAWRAFYGQKTGYWWDAIYPHDRLDNVIEWCDKN